MTTAVTGKSVSARIADRLAESLGSRRYSMWFGHSVKLEYHDPTRRVEIAVPSRFVADWVGKNLQDEIHAAARQELGDAVGLNLRIRPEAFNGDAAPPQGGLEARSLRVPVKPTVGVTPPSSGPAAALPVVYTPTQGRRSGRSDQPTRLNLADFVVGPSNELAFSAANRLIEDDDTAINPLFIHGGCGLGKTHLLQGVCRRFLEQKPDARVLYTTGEQFTNEFLTAMRGNRTDQFRKKVRRLDLLAVDDVHFLANKQATQQEFLHSFDAIEMGGARVVLASDSHPTLIQQFSEALVSRCVRGMVVQVHQPDEATRVQIIHALARRRGLTMLDNVAELLATRCLGSVREIEGALTQVHALASLARTRRPGSSRVVNSPGAIVVDKAVVDHLFQSQRQSPRKPIRFDTLLAVVVRELGIERADILGSSRHHKAVLGRSLVVHIARQLTTMSYPEIASAMGRRTHSTIITAAHRVGRQIALNPVVTLPATMEQVSLASLVERLNQAVLRA